MSSKEVQAILDKTVNGERLSVEDALVLYNSDDLEAIGKAAFQVRKKWHPDNDVTYVVGRNINYTNVCDIFCKFCAFCEKEGSEHAYTLSHEDLLAKIQEADELGATEILMQGGTNPNIPFEYYLEFLRKVKAQSPNLTIHSFSPAEVWKMVEVSGLSLEEVMTQLHEAGLDSLPGGGAEILDNDVRMKVSRVKGTWEKWMECMKMAKKVGMHGTATMVIGLGETYEQRIMHFKRVRDAQDETGCFLAFISWAYQPVKTLPGEKTTPEEYLKHLAISRLFIDNIPNFQSSWITMGPEVGKRSLQYGSNDMGGSAIIEENVVRAAGVENKVTPEYIRQLIREAGFTPVQRNTKYKHLKRFED